MSSDNDYIGILFNRRHIVLNNYNDRWGWTRKPWEKTQNEEGENRVYGKRKERLAREEEEGQEGMSWLVVVVRGFMEEEVQQYLKIIFWVCFCVQRWFEVSRREG